LRSNGGGSVANISKLVSRFTDKRFLAWKEAEKSGPGKQNLTAFKETYIDPKGDKKYLRPVIILTNRRCFSATTLCVAAMLNLPNVKVIGDWTGGGGGGPSSTQLPNGWVVRYSSTITLMPNGFNIENGTPPTIKQDMTKEDEAKGIDSIIERALRELK
jgi:C-terminal processing protease CtpA/Prc